MKRYLANELKMLDFLRPQLLFKNNWLHYFIFPNVSLYFIFYNLPKQLKIYFYKLFFDTGEIDDVASDIASDIKKYFDSMVGNHVDIVVVEEKQSNPEVVINNNITPVPQEKSWWWYLKIGMIFSGGALGAFGLYSLIIYFNGDSSSVILELSREQHSHLTSILELLLKDSKNHSDLTINMINKQNETITQNTDTIIKLINKCISSSFKPFSKILPSNDHKEKWE